MNKPINQKKDTGIKTNTILTATLLGALAFTSAQAQQYPNPTTAAEVPCPAAGNTMTKEYVRMVGRMAYFWGWPLVANFRIAVKGEQDEAQVE